MQMAFHGLRFADSELAKFCVPMKPTQAQPGEAARAPDGAPASGHWLDGISAVAYTRLAADYSASEDMPWEPPQFGYSEASTQLFQKDLLKWVTWLPAQFKLRAGTPPVMNPAAAMKLQEVMGAMEQHCCAFALQVSKRNRLARQIQRDTAVLEEAIRDAQARGRPAEPRRAPSAEQMSQLRELLRRIGEEREPGEE
jgi:hypothetical protein